MMSVNTSLADRGRSVLCCGKLALQQCLLVAPAELNSLSGPALSSATCTSFHAHTCLLLLQLGLRLVYKCICVRRVRMPFSDPV